MKNNIYLALLLFSTYTFSQAPIGFYLNIGANQTAIQSKDLLTVAKPGYTAGINFLMGYHETYNYQIEVSYLNNPINIKATDLNFVDLKESEYKYSALNIAFYLNYYILKPDEDKFFVGPQAGFFISFVSPLKPADGSSKNDELYLPYLLDDQALSKSNEFDAGPGLGFTGGYNDFRFDLRYSIGLSNVLEKVQLNQYDQSNRYIGPTLEGKAKGISFGISYKIF